MSHAPVPGTDTRVSRKCAESVSTALLSCKHGAYLADMSGARHRYERLAKW
jgi:hypothetical protein